MTEMSQPKVTARLRFAAAIILLLGLSSAVVVYLAVSNGPNRSQNYEFENGSAYPVAPEDSKRYMHDLELYGGKANVLASEFMHWFDSLWHGKSLAFTIAVLTVLISSGLLLASRKSP